jgi:hypothetical protein
MLASLSARKLAAAAVASTDLKLTLVQEFAKSSVKAISPDGTKLCLEDWAVGYPLRVVAIGTWQTIYTGRFKSRVGIVQFEGDNQTLFLEGPGAAFKNQYWQAVLDLHTGELTERMHPLDSTNSADYTYAAGNRTLLVAHCEYKPFARIETLALVEFPDYREIAKAAYATQPREPKRFIGKWPIATDFDFKVSDDRSIFVYSFDHVLVCRRMEDLNVLWTRPIEQGVYAFRVFTSAHGNLVAAAVSDSVSPQQHRYYISIYDGKTGSSVARLPFSGTEGVALSPDGKLIAVVAIEPGKEGKLLPTVYIHEVSSDLRLASVEHNPIKRGRRQFLEAHIDVLFTSDGQYLVTSGMATKVWKIERS